MDLRRHLSVFVKGIIFSVDYGNLQCLLCSIKALKSYNVQYKPVKFFYGNNKSFKVFDEHKKPSYALYWRQKQFEDFYG